MSPHPPSGSHAIRAAGRRLVLAAVLACTVALVGASVAQAQVFMNAQPVPLPSAYPADWGATHSLVRLLMTNSAGEPVRCDLRVLIEQDGSTATVTVPRQFDVGPTYLTTPQVTNWSRLAFNGAMKRALERTGHLAARPIQVTIFCENMFGLVTNNPIPEVQATIVIVPSVPPPPTLLTPADGGPLRTSQPVFTWTPVRLTTGEEVWYQFRLVRVLPHQTPSRAVEANYAVYETFVHQSNLAYPLDAPRLEEGGLYAWRVQALVNASTDIHDVPQPGEYSHVGLNDGRSRVRSFVWQQAADGADGAARSGPLMSIGADDRGTPIARSTDPLARVPVESATDAAWGPVATGTVGAWGDRATAGTSSDPAPGDDPASGDVVAGPPGAGGAPARMLRRRIDVDAGLPAGEGIAAPWLRVSGTAVAAGEVYTRQGAGDPTRPDQNGQFVAGLMLSTFHGRVQVPVQALVSGDQVSFRQGINRIGVHPQWNWGGLHAGTIQPGYSPFSLADATLQGGGVDVVRDGWYASFVDGRVQKAITPDPVHAVEAQYARNVMAGRIGLGQPFGDAIEFEAMRARDDAGSLTAGDSLVRVAPAGNLILGARARHTVFDTLTQVQVEGAWSQYERDVQGDVPIVNGGAGGVRVTRRSLRGEVGAAFDYVGGGFISLANAELAPDRLEGRLNGRRDLFEGTLHVGGSVGLRRDDLSGTLGGGTTRHLYGAQLGWQPTALFGSDLDVQRLEGRSPGTDLRESLDEVTTAFTLSPHLQWSWRGSQHTLTSTLNVQTTEFATPGATPFPDTRNTLVVAGWQSTVTPAVLFNVSGNFVRSEVGGIATETEAVGPGLSMTWLGGRARTNVQLQLQQTRVPGFGTDRDLAPSLDLRYLVTGRQMLTFRASSRRFRTPAAAAGDFEERLATVQYSASL